MGGPDPSKRGGPATRSQRVGSGPAGCGRWATTLPRGTGSRRLSPKWLLGKRTHEELQQRGVEGARFLRPVAPVSEGPDPRRQQIPPGDRRRCARPPQRRGEPAARSDQHDHAELVRSSLPPHRPAGSPWPGPAPLRSAEFSPSTAVAAIVVPGAGLTSRGQWLRLRFYETVNQTTAHSGVQLFCKANHRCRGPDSGHRVLGFDSRGYLQSLQAQAYCVRSNSLFNVNRTVSISVTVFGFRPHYNLGLLIVTTVIKHN